MHEVEAIGKQCGVAECGGGEVLVLDGHGDDPRVRERCLDLREVPLLVPARSDALVDLEDGDGLPRHVLGVEQLEQRLDAAAGEGERERAPLVDA